MLNVDEIFEIETRLRNSIDKQFFNPESDYVGTAEEEAAYKAFAAVQDLGRVLSESSKKSA